MHKNIEIGIAVLMITTRVMVIVRRVVIVHCSVCFGSSIVLFSSAVSTLGSFLPYYLMSYLLHLKVFKKVSLYCV